MARLNEPPSATDSLELLRRKFLRQNRDIARVNSNQSLKIRTLENECARLLSENLDLRGQILRLEKELDDSSAQRIADHAMEIKNKMEAQLLEWGSMLSGLGLEPPAKRHSPMSRRTARSRQSMSRSPAQRPRRESVKDEEALAVQEGRLPPIYENKSYARKTMNRDEILALCEDAADSTNSPILGPPPVSRYVEDEPVKVDSPPRPEVQIKISEKTKLPETSGTLEQTAPVRLDHERKPIPVVEAPPSPVKKPSQAMVDATEQRLQAGSKRKFAVNDENEHARSLKTTSTKPRLGGGDENNAAAHAVKGQRKIKELPMGRKEHRDASQPRLSAARKPLSAKSTNQDVSSPRKSAKVPVPDEIAAAKAAPKEKHREKRTVVIDVTKPPRPVSVDIPVELEPATPFIEAGEPVPDTPVRSTEKGGSHDTPPPGDISSNGETSRPSRRSRTSVSYAEPNLRAKMRRPTKELYDAVAGEGRYLQRHKSEDAATGPSSSVKIKTEPESAESWAKIPALAMEEHRRESVASPLARKEPAPAPPPVAIAGERRKRHSSMGLKAIMGSHAALSTSLDTPDANDNTDPYEFTSSPAADSKESVAPQSKASGIKPARTSRRTSMAPRDDTALGAKSATAQSVKGPSLSRKRASLAMPRKAALLDGDDEADSSYEEPRRATKDGSDHAPMDRISRRRSMML